jgi:hypothetical protein
MSAIDASTAAAAATGVRAPHDVRHATRVLAAVVLPVGPAAVAVLRYVLPYSTTDDDRAIVRAVSAHQGTESAVVWLGFLAVLTLVPAVMWAGRLTRPAAPRLTAVAMLLLIPAYTCMGLLVCSDAAVLFAVRRHLDPATAGGAYAGLHPAIVAAGVVFVLGHVVGTVLLGIAFWRTGAVPRWAALATSAAQPLHFLAAVVLANHTLDLVGWGLNALGFAAASLAILRLRDDRWDVAPQRG